DQPAGGGGNSLHARIAGRLLAWQPWERVGLKGGCRSVARVVAHAEPCPQPERPEFVRVRVENAEEIVVVTGEYHELVIRQYSSVGPHKQAMLGDRWCADEAGKRFDRGAHTRARFRVNPPLLAIGASRVGSTRRLDVLPDILEWLLVEGCVLFRGVRAKI